MLKESCEVIDEFTFPAGLITHVCSRYERNQGAHGCHMRIRMVPRIYYVPGSGNVFYLNGGNHNNE